MSQADDPRGPGQAIGRLRRLALKELRETLRDRRTIITLVLMPLLVYPLLSLIFRSFLASGALPAPQTKPTLFRFAFQHDLEEMQFAREFLELSRVVKRLEDDRDPLLEKYRGSEPPTYGRLADNEFQTAADARRLVAEGLADAAAIWTFNSDSKPVPVEVVWQQGDRFSVDAARYLRDYLEAVHRDQLRRRGTLDSGRYLIDERPVTPLRARQSPIALGTLVPLILVLMTITGAVYPAIDLTAGERERGTLEALVAAPIPRISILLAKFIAVLTVATLTATLNLVGMFTTIWAFQLESLVFPDQQVPWAALVQIFALLLLYAAFFSALLLAVTSLARSFKEAQAYLIPLILLSLAPCVVSLSPGLKLNGPLAVVPMVNFVLLSRDLFQQQATWLPALVVVGSTIAYALAALWAASRIFGTDAILYGSHASLQESLRRPSRPRATATPAAAWFATALLFSANFIALSLLSRSAQQPIEVQLALMSALMILFFGGLPAAIAWYLKIPWTSGFALRRPPTAAWITAPLLGLTLWPLVFLLVSWAQQWIGWLGGDQSSSEFQRRLVEGGQAYVERWRQVAPGLILLTHAVIPAAVEEWFFRGMLLQALLPRARTAWQPILLNGVVFGAFHVLTQSVFAADRFLPSSLMGVLLAALCWRTGSILPGMIVHMLHNATVVSLAYFHQELQTIPWLPLDDHGLPWPWFMALLTVAAFSLAAIWKWGRRTSPPSTPAA